MSVVFNKYYLNENTMSRSRPPHTSHLTHHTLPIAPYPVFYSSYLWTAERGYVDKFNVFALAGIMPITKDDFLFRMPYLIAYDKMITK